VHLTVAIVDFLTPYKRRRHGICSSFFQSLDPSKEPKRVPMWIKKGLFEPPSLDRDVLLIGPGTGLASMRAMVQEREFLRQQAGGNSGTTYLYFGCRHENKVRTQPGALQRRVHLKLTLLSVGLSVWGRAPCTRDFRRPH
jgi:sulfite reductase alpha subunit-like flavoprotein